MSGTRHHVRDCRHFGTLTLCTRFKTCQQLEGWASLRHDPSGCGGCWYLTMKLMTPSKTLCKPQEHCIRMMVHLYMYTSIDNPAESYKYLLSSPYRMSLQWLTYFLQMRDPHPPTPAGQGKTLLMALHHTQTQPHPQKRRATPNHTHRGEEKGPPNPPTTAIYGEGKEAWTMRGRGPRQQARDHMYI